MFRSLLVCLASAVVALSSIAGLEAPAAAQEKKTESPTLGKIERLDPRFEALVPKDARIEILASGFTWAEGPVWVKEGGYLLFSDIPRNSVFKWKDGDGISLFLRPSGYTGAAYYGLEPGCNGLLLDREGRLVSMEHGDRRVSALYKDGGKRTLVDSYMGKRLNSPNDGTFKSNGDLYFTDPPYGLPNRMNDHRKELDFQGVYRYSADGKLTLLTKTIKYPNGIAFSPDEKTLYVAQSDPENATWTQFPVRDDGTLGEGKVLFDATKMVGKHKGLPDGMKVDVKGNLFATGPGGVLVFSPDGTHLGTLYTGEATANCGWGEDGSTLFICADMHICRIKLTTKGIPSLADRSLASLSDLSDIVRRRLRTPITVEFIDQPLDDALSFVATMTRLDLRLDAENLRDTDLSARPMTLTMRNVSVIDVLRSFTGSDLVYATNAAGSELLLTTRQGAAAQNLRVVILKDQ